MSEYFLLNSRGYSQSYLNWEENFNATYLSFNPKVSLGLANKIDVLAGWSLNVLYHINKKNIDNLSRIDHGPEIGLAFRIIPSFGLSINYYNGLNHLFSASHVSDFGELTEQQDYIKFQTISLRCHF